MLHAFVPPELALILAPLYEARNREVCFETEQITPADGHAAVRTRFESGRGVAWVALDRITSGTFDGVQAAINAMETSASAATACAGSEERPVHSGFSSSSELSLQ